MPNVADLLTHSATAHPERPATRLGGSALAYAALDALAARVAGLLRAKGVEPGGRVGLMLPNVPYFAGCYYGALRSGAAAVPMDVRLGEREVAFYLRDARAEVLLAWHECADLAHAGAEPVDAEVVLVEPGDFERLLGGCDPVADVAPRAAGDTAVVLDCAELTHADVLSDVEVDVGRYGLDERTVTLGALPFLGLDATIAVGGCVTLLARFDPAAAREIIRREAVTLFAGLPAMYAAMLERAGAVNGDVVRAFEKRFGCRVLEAACDHFEHCGAET
jgi:long-chain acyl-CoA synthetase